MRNFFVFLLYLIFLVSPSFGYYVISSGGARIVSNSSTCAFGRVEFYGYNSTTGTYQWGSFSNVYSSWDSYETGYFCGSLGFSASGGTTYSYSSGYDTAVGGRAKYISFDYAYCSNPLYYSSYDICDDCTFTWYYSESHLDDIYVKCSGTSTKTCTYYSSLPTSSSTVCEDDYSSSYSTATSLAIGIIILIVFLTTCFPICICIIVCIFCPIWCCTRTKPAPVTTTQIISTVPQQQQGVGMTVYSQPVPGQQYPGSMPQYPTPAQQYPGSMPQYATPAQQYPGSMPQYATPMQQYPGPSNPQYAQQMPMYPNPSSAPMGQVETSAPPVSAPYAPGYNTEAPALSGETTEGFR